MKKKNIKKILKKKIESGWREYLSLKIPYSLVGLNREDFMTDKDIEDLLDVKMGEESGIVHNYNTLDYNYMYKDQPMNVDIRFDWSYLHGRTPEEFCKEILNMTTDAMYVIKNDKIYYIECVCGYKNPKCIWNEEKLEFPEDEPYWLYENDEKHCRYDSYYTSPDKDVELLLQKFINNKEFAENMFSGNFVFSLLSGNFGDNINNELFKDLSSLASLCKTTYEDFFEDHIYLTFAIRYKEYVEEFLTKLKKIISKHKINVSIL